MMTKCPYCGSNDIEAEIDISRITGVLSKDGTISVKHHWLDEEIREMSPSNIHGYCNDCGYYCNFEWDNGYVKK